jgi:hypothetical protein
VNDSLGTEYRPLLFQSAPVFIYSGFRASSTWLWTKFRAHPALMCYYEPFNEQLANLTLENIAEAAPDGWRSHHPRSAPYNLEYSGLLGDEPGVRDFSPDMGLGRRYLDAGGLASTLDEDIRAYIDGLIVHARHRGRIPLLSCTRMLGRAETLRKAFGGYHILLVRNLFHKWNSYAGQARFGNWYFLHTLYETLQLADRDPVIAWLRQSFDDNVCASFNAWISEHNFDRVFCYFVGFHLHFLASARRSADTVIELSGLVDADPTYRDRVIDKILADLGIPLNLDDVSERVDLPIYQIASPETCRILIDEIAATIKSLRNADPDEQAFIDRLVAALWREQGIFSRHTAGAIEYIDEIENRLRDSERAKADGFAAAQGARDALTTAFDIERQELMRKISACEDRIVCQDAQAAEHQAMGVERDRALIENERNSAAARSAEQRLADLSQVLTDKEAEAAAAIDKLSAAQHRLEEIDRERQCREADLDAMRHRLEERSTGLARATDENDHLRLMLADAENKAAALQAQAERVAAILARVDQANLDMTGRLAELERRLRLSETRHAERTSEGVRSSDPIDYVSHIEPGVHAIMDLMLRHRVQWALLPAPVWRRRVSEALLILPGFEPVGDGAATSMPVRQISEGLVRDLPGGETMRQG